MLEGFKTQKSPSKFEKCQIFYISLSLKMLKNALGLRFRGANAFYVSYGFAFFVLQTLCIWYYIPKTYLGGKHCFQKILETLKRKSHLQKPG